MYSAEHVLSVGDVMFNLDCLARTPVCFKNGHGILLQGGKKLRVIYVDVHEMSMDYVMFEVELGHGRPLLCPSVFTL